MTPFGKRRPRIAQLRKETYALYLAYKDPRVPWYAKVLAACVVAYALSPIDLIPDFIPVLGYLDDLVLVPAGIAIAIRLIPPEVLNECREKAEEALGGTKRSMWVAAGLIIGIWVFLGLLAFLLVFRALRGSR